MNWIFLWVKFFCNNVGAYHIIYMGKPVGSRKYWMNDHCGTKWRLIKCRLSIHRYPESSNPILARLTSDNEMQSPFAPLCAAAIGILSISHAFYHEQATQAWWIRFYLYIGVAHTNSVHDIRQYDIRQVVRFESVEESRVWIFRIWGLSFRHSR